MLWNIFVFCGNTQHQFIDAFRTGTHTEPHWWKNPNLPVVLVHFDGWLDSGMKEKDKLPVLQHRLWPDNDPKFTLSLALEMLT